MERKTNNNPQAPWEKKQAEQKRLASHRERLKEMEKDSQSILSRKQKKQENAALRYSHLGIEFAVIFGFIFFGGYKIDEKWNTSPWFTLLGVVLGFSIAMLRLVRAAQELEKETDEEHD